MNEITNEQLAILIEDLINTGHSDKATELLKMDITHYQNIQKQNRPDSAAWQEASERLAPLFKLMAQIS